MFTNSKLCTQDATQNSQLETHLFLDRTVVTYDVTTAQILDVMNDVCDTGLHEMSLVTMLLTNVSLGKGPFTLECQRQCSDVASDIAPIYCSQIS